MAEPTDALTRCSGILPTCLLAGSLLGVACGPPPTTAAAPEAPEAPRSSEDPVDSSRTAPASAVGAPTRPKVAPVANLETCTLDGFRQLSREELGDVPPQTGDWYVREDPVPGYRANINVGDIQYAGLPRTMETLQTASPFEAGLICEAIMKGVDVSSERSHAVDVELRETSWGRTCQLQLERTDREGIHVLLTLAPEGSSYVMVISSFTEGDTVTPAAHDQLVECRPSSTSAA